MKGRDLAERGPRKRSVELPKPRQQQISAMQSKRRHPSIGLATITMRLRQLWLGRAAVQRPLKMPQMLTVCPVELVRPQPAMLHLNGKISMRRSILKLTFRRMWKTHPIGSDISDDNRTVGVVSACATDNAREHCPSSVGHFARINLC